MKKILITLTVLFAVIDIMAQEHLSFKGIPIEGSMTEFCQKLKSKGFTSIGRENNITLFSGDFTGRQATVGVTATDDGKNVFAVVVLFDPSGEWNTLVNTYDYYKDLYTRKYGKPTISKENNPAHLDSNTALMAEVHQGTVVYGISTTQWRTVSDSKNLLYFFESSLTPNTFWVNLRETDLSEGAPVLKLSIANGETYHGNATKEFKPAQPFRFMGVKG